MSAFTSGASKTGSRGMRIDRIADGICEGNAAGSRWLAPTTGSILWNASHHPVLLRLRVAERLSRVDAAPEARARARRRRRAGAGPLLRAPRRPRPDRPRRVSREGTVDGEEPGAQGRPPRRS